MGYNEQRKRIARLTWFRVSPPPRGPNAIKFPTWRLEAVSKGGPPQRPLGRKFTWNRCCILGSRPAEWTIRYRRPGSRNNRERAGHRPRISPLPRSRTVRKIVAGPLSVVFRFYCPSFVSPVPCGPLVPKNIVHRRKSSSSSSSFVKVDFILYYIIVAVVVSSSERTACRTVYTRLIYFRRLVLSLCSPCLRRIRPFFLSSSTPLSHACDPPHSIILFNARRLIANQLRNIAALM